jgi:hypothetical protein
MSIRELLSRVPMQLIALIIVVAGLAYYALKRTGYIEGLETKEHESKEEQEQHTKTTNTTIKNIIS